MKQQGTPFASLVEILLAQDVAGEAGPAYVVARAAYVYKKLFAVSAPVLGADGTRALFARSVKLTKAEHPDFGEVVVTPVLAESVLIEDVVFGRLAALDPAVASEVISALFANLLGLMATFIGERLVRQLLKRAFPAMGETGLETRK